MSYSNTCLHLVLLMILPLSMVGQNATNLFSDDLKINLRIVDKLIDENHLDTAEIICHNLIQKYRQTKYDKGEQYIHTRLNEIRIAKEDYSLANKSIDDRLAFFQVKQDSTLYATTLMQKAQCLMYLNQSSEADLYFEKSIALFPKNDENLSLAWNDRGYNAGRVGDFENEGKYYLQALTIAEAKSDKYGEAMAYNNLSVLYQNIGKTSQAIEYAKKSIAIREQLNDLPKLLSSYNNLSQIYLRTDLKEAERYAKLCKKVADKLNTENALITALDAESLVQDQYGKTEVQLSNAKIILDIYEKRKNTDSELVRRYLSLGIIMSEMRKDSAEALTYIDKGISLAKKINDKVSLRDGLLAKTIFFKIRHDFYNAYENIKQYHLYKDSIINQHTISNIAELQTKYEIEKKDFAIDRLTAEQRIKELKIAQLNSDQQLKTLQIEKQQAIIAGNKILAQQKEDEIQLLSQKKLLQELAFQKQKEELANQVLLSKTQEQQLNINNIEKEWQEKQLKQQKQLNYILAAAGFILFLLMFGLFNRYKMKKQIQNQQMLLDMRDAIAKDLHDEVGSTLSSIKILSEVSFKNIDHNAEKSGNLLQKIMEQSEQMQLGLSDIVWAVNPQNDKIEDLISKLKEYIHHTLEPKGVDVIFNVDDDHNLKSIDLTQRRNILLICREAINNIAKYANCTKAIIAFKFTKNNIFISISDNGTGFEKQDIQKGNGLKNMEARTLASNGKFTIQSQPNKGTQLSIELPILYI